MRQFSEMPDGRPDIATPLFAHTSEMHGERTRVEVFSRIPDFVFRTLKLGKMELLTMRCGTVALRRDSSDVRSRSNCMSTFILQVHGRSLFGHYGNQIELEAGDITLCNNSTQYEWRLEGTSEILLFRVPTQMLNDIIPTPDILCGRRLARHEGLASMAGVMAQDLAAKDQGQFSPEIGERAGKHLLGVLASAYVPLLDDWNSGSAVMSGRFWKVKLFIEEHLRDPELSPSFIARNLQLSDRYLRMIFAVSNESPSAYILRRRLEECAAQLRDPRWRQYSITDIAFSWGFNSAPHFARSFRSRYHSTPRDFRNKKLA